MNTFTPIMKGTPQRASCVAQSSVQPLGCGVQPLVAIMPLPGGRKPENSIKRNAIVSGKCGIPNGRQQSIVRTHLYATMQDQAVMKSIEQDASWSWDARVEGNDFNKVAVPQGRGHTRALSLKDYGHAAGQEGWNKFCSGMLSRHELTFHSIRKDR